MSSKAEYWADALGEALEAIGKFDTLTHAEINECGEALATSAECMSMAFYSPPDSDRISEIDREWKRRLTALQAEFDQYRGGAETAIKRALRQHSDANVSISKDGSVTRFGGRAEQIL